MCLNDARCQSQGFVENSTEFLIGLTNVLEQTMQNVNQGTFWPTRLSPASYSPSPT